MRRIAEDLRRRDGTIAFVPTMGFLHDGHLALMREGRQRASVLVVSIFVNPSQFGPNEDFERYPRALQKDLEKIERIPADYVFAPDTRAMLPADTETWVEVTGVTRGLCGAHRPGHFRGVTTIVAKLFNLVQPHIAIFGEKDFQQLRAIQKMVHDLNFAVEIIPHPIVREPDGLAMSSRNAYLSPKQRNEALALSQSLFAARELSAAGTRDPDAIVQAARRVLDRSADIKLEYLEAVDWETLAKPSAHRSMLLAVAARVGDTRLIDNIALHNPA